MLGNKFGRWGGFRTARWSFKHNGFIWACNGDDSYLKKEASFEKTFVYIYSQPQKQHFCRVSMFFFGLSFFTEQRDFGKSAEHFSNPLNCHMDRLFFFGKKSLNR